MTAKFTVITYLIGEIYLGAGRPSENEPDGSPFEHDRIHQTGCTAVANFYKCTGTNSIPA